MVSLIKRVSEGESPGDIPDRPGISTPLAPRIMVTTPWAEVGVARRERRMTS
jgi:hypothetical protein